MEWLAQSQEQANSHMLELEKQVSLLVEVVCRRESLGTLPSQTEPNPKENEIAITLRSETVVEPPIQKQDEKPTNSESQEEDGATTEEGVPTAEPEQSPYAEFRHEFIEDNFVESCRKYDDSDNEFRELEPNYSVKSILSKELFTKFLPLVLQAPQIELKELPVIGSTKLSEKGRTIQSVPYASTKKPLGG